MECLQCKLDFSRNKGSISCDFCDGKLHTKYALVNNPDLSQVMLDQIKNSKCVLAFRCKNCVNVMCDEGAGANGVIRKVTDMDNVSNKLNSMEASIKMLSNLVSNSVVSDLNTIKTELANSVATLVKDEEFAVTKIKRLEVENNFIRKQLIQGDVLISGLPSTLALDSIYDIIPKIGKVYQLDFQPYDIGQCSWIRNQKMVLVKFNSVRKRDELMKRYFNTRNLQLDQIMETNIKKRIYLNENITPIAAGLNYLCRKLLKVKKITNVN